MVKIEMYRLAGNSVDILSKMSEHEITSMGTLMQNVTIMKCSFGDIVGAVNNGKDVCNEI